MANTKFQLKRSVVPGKIPQASDLEIGEIALNLSDQKGYTKHSTGNVIVLFDYVEANTAYLTSQAAYNQANTANVNAANASFLSTGTVNTARLGSGTANANTYLSGDNTWKPISTPVRQSFYAATNQTTFVVTGGYTANNIDVFLNGVKLLNGTDVTISSGNTIVLTVPAAYNDVIDVSGSTLPLAIADTIRKTGDTMTGTLVVPEINMTSGAITATTIAVNTTTANQVIDLFSTSSYRSVKYLVQVTSGTSYQASEILLVHDGTNSYLTEYGTIFTGSVLGSFDTSISSGNTRLLFSAVNATNTLRIVRTSIIT